jgi:prevent-host-death family protein
MLTLGAREAKNEFGRMLDAAQSEGVLIKKKGRPVAIVLSVKAYQLLDYLCMIRGYNKLCKNIFTYCF